MEDAGLLAPSLGHERSEDGAIVRVDHEHRRIREKIVWTVGNRAVIHARQREAMTSGREEQSLLVSRDGLVWEENA